MLPKVSLVLVKVICDQQQFWRTNNYCGHLILALHTQLASNIAHLCALPSFKLGVLEPPFENTQSSAQAKKQKLSHQRSSTSK